MLVLVGDDLLDLGVLSLDPGVMLVAVSVKFSESAQAFLWMTMINKPTRGLVGGQQRNYQNTPSVLPRERP